MKWFTFKRFTAVVILVMLAGGAWFGWLYSRFYFKKDDVLEQLSRLNLQLQGRADAFVLSVPSRIYDQTGSRLLAEFSPEKRRVLTLSEIDRLKKFKDTLLSAEDRDFYNHDGYSFEYIGRALLRTLFYMKVSGGSTVTQQLAKLLFTDASRSIERKVLELFYTSEIEKRYDKDTILAMYLNKIYFGHRRYGIYEASRYYFDREPADLGQVEVSMLVGIIPNPTAFSPRNRLQKAMYKQRLVLRLLEEKGLAKKGKIKAEQKEFFSRYRIPADLQKRFADPFTELKPLVEPPEDGFISALGRHPAQVEETAFGHIKEYVRRFVSDNLGEAKLHEGLTVFTTVDAVKQRAAFKRLSRAVDRLRDDVVTRLKKAVKDQNLEAIDRLIEEKQTFNGALVTVNPHNGFIEAMVGGYTFSSANQLNRVTQSRRQPGSTIKPFVYLLAFDEDSRMGPLSCWPDRPFSKAGYSPGNWYRGYKGPMSVSEALAVSVNTASVRALDLAGPARLQALIGRVLQLPSAELKKRFSNDLSMALGSKEMSPLELETMYATLLNNGRRVEPLLILKILDSRGNLVYGRDPVLEGDQVMSADHAFEIIQMMQLVVSDQGIVNYITRRRKADASFLPFPIAGKTGSVQLHPKLRKKFAKTHRGRTVKDVWFAGLTSNSASVVWLGNDLGYPFKGGGSSVAAPVWAQYANDVYSDERYSGEEKTQAAAALKEQNPVLYRRLFGQAVKVEKQAGQSDSQADADDPQGLAVVVTVKADGTVIEPLAAGGTEPNAAGDSAGNKAGDTADEFENGDSVADNQGADELSGSGEGFKVSRHNHGQLVYPTAFEPPAGREFTVGLHCPRGHDDCAGWPLAHLPREQSTACPADE